MKSSAEHSKFWLDPKFDNQDFDQNNTLDLIRLAAIRRAIANFVFIISGKDIPVKFAEEATSATDGKTVHIGGEIITQGKFDEMVGLCLHEGCHIAQSDFAMFKNLWFKIPKEVYDAANKKLSKKVVQEFCTTMLNFVEDAYIDAWAYEEAPGYRGYYDALFKQFCNSPLITDGLKSDAFRTPTIDNYEHRIIFLSNPASDLDALPGLRDVAHELDLPNILRLGAPKDRLDTALKIAIIVLVNIMKQEEQKEKQEGGEVQDNDATSGEAGEKTEGGEDKSGAPKPEEPPTEEKEDDVSKPEDKPAVKVEDKKEKPAEPTDQGNLSDEKYDTIKKEFAEQKDRVNGEGKSTKGLSKAVLDKLSMLEKSQVDMVPVGGGEVPEVDCVVVRNMTKELMHSGNFPFSSKIMSHQVSSSDSGVTDGIRLGTMLGKKLQLRGESRTTRFVRLGKGKIEKRLISELGFDNERVFYQTSVDQYKAAHLHISVDASRSMQPKWKKTMTAVVAMAKAASMITNLSVTISFRAGIISERNRSSHIPYVVLAYDSRKDKFSKVVQLFPYLFPNGCTPEGLAFEAILDNMQPSTQDLDSYFVNLSDGQPYFDGYAGKKACDHTRKIINKIRASNIEVLSYFLDEESVVSYATSDESTTCREAFLTMYGKDSLFIDVDSVAEIARTMNKKFLQRSN